MEPGFLGGPVQAPPHVYLNGNDVEVVDMTGPPKLSTALSTAEQGGIHPQGKRKPRHRVEFEIEDKLQSERDGQVDRCNGAIRTTTTLALPTTHWKSGFEANSEYPFVRKKDDTETTISLALRHVDPRGSTNLSRSLTSYLRALKSNFPSMYARCQFASRTTKKLAGSAGTTRNTVNKTIMISCCGLHTLLYTGTGQTGFACSGVERWLPKCCPQGSQLSGDVTSCVSSGTEVSDTIVSATTDNRILEYRLEHKTQFSCVKHEPFLVQDDTFVIAGNNVVIYSEAGENWTLPMTEMCVDSLYIPPSQEQQPMFVALLCPACSDLTCLNKCCLENHQIRISEDGNVISCVNATEPFESQRFLGSNSSRIRGQDGTAGSLAHTHMTLSDSPCTQVKESLSHITER
ncbi:hypothetical protein J6590_052298 [Homalodisca vitripennis]|nr:hypothetical protein J6590_052298 [Homalodisca vitripennis]